jgi:hypothetical protein
MRSSEGISEQKQAKKESVTTALENSARLTVHANNPVVNLMAQPREEPKHLSLLAAVSDNGTTFIVWHQKQC